MFFHLLYIGIEGLVIGLLVSIPLGPVGVLCIQRTLNKGRLSGFASGLGAALADTFYATIAGFGVSAIMQYLFEYESILKTVGAILLIIMGIKLIRTNPAVQLRKSRLQKKGKGFFADLASVFVLTILNPVTFVAFITFFANIKTLQEHPYALSVLTLILSVMAGALLWWLTLIFIVSIFRNKFRLRIMLYINRVSGIIVELFAIYVLLSVFFPNILGFL